MNGGAGFGSVQDGITLRRGAPGLFTSSLLFGDRIADGGGGAIPGSRRPGLPPWHGSARTLTGREGPSGQLRRITAPASSGLWPRTRMRAACRADSRLEPASAAADPERCAARGRGSTADLGSRRCRFGHTVLRHRLHPRRACSPGWLAEVPVDRRAVPVRSPIAWKAPARFGWTPQGLRPIGIWFGTRSGTDGRQPRWPRALVSRHHPARFLNSLLPSCQGGNPCARETSAASLPPSVRIAGKSEDSVNVTRSFREGSRIDRLPASTGATAAAGGIEDPRTSSVAADPERGMNCRLGTGRADLADGRKEAPPCVR